MESPEKTPEFSKKYPFMLIGGKSDIPEGKGAGSGVDELVTSVWAEVNPEDASKYHIKDGEAIWIESKVGKEIFPVKLNRGLKRGVVWVRASDAGIKGAVSRFSLFAPTINSLIDEQSNDPIVGSARRCEMLVRIGPVPGRAR